MLALLGLALSQCESGRLVAEISVARYAPFCCAGESYVWFEDVTSAQMETLKNAFVTVAPQTDTSLELPTSEYLISNDMRLQFRDDGNQTWNETSGAMEPAYLYLSYSNYPPDYPPNEPATANTYFSIGANRDQAVYDAYTALDGPALFRVYVDECNSPPSHPPPPPTVAMCHEGYWPLYMTEGEAMMMSDLGTAHVHTFGGVDFYMPDAFPGALHAENSWCPWHSKTIPPFPPPSPKAPPTPPPPLAPPSAPPPYELPVPVQVVLMVIGAGLILCIAVACISWHLWYGSARTKATLPVRQEQQRFFKL